MHVRLIGMGVCWLRVSFGFLTPGGGSRVRRIVGVKGGDREGGSRCNANADVGLGWG